MGLRKERITNRRMLRGKSKAGRSYPSIFSSTETKLTFTPGQISSKDVGEVRKLFESSISTAADEQLTHLTTAAAKYLRAHNLPDRLDMVLVRGDGTWSFVDRMTIPGRGERCCSGPLDLTEKNSATHFAAKSLIYASRAKKCMERQELKDAVEAAMLATDYYWRGWVARNELAFHIGSRTIQKAKEPRARQAQRTVIETEFRRLRQANPVLSDTQVRKLASSNLTQANGRGYSYASLRKVPIPK
jgi:hypothetical protein